MIVPFFALRLGAAAAFTGALRLSHEVTARQLESAELYLHLWPTRIPGTARSGGHPGQPAQQAVTGALTRPPLLSLRIDAVVWPRNFTQHFHLGSVTG